MFYKFSLLITFLCVPYSTQLKPCANVTTVENFDWNRFSGRWYEITKLLPFQLNQKCSAINFTVLDLSPTIKLNNTCIDTALGEFVQAIGHAYPIDPKIQSSVLWAIPFIGPLYTNLPFKIVDTNYDDYAVVYSCQNYYTIYWEYAWIFSRTKSLDPSVEEKLKGILEGFGIDTLRFYHTDQTNCPF